MYHNNSTLSTSFQKKIDHTQKKAVSKQLTALRVFAKCDVNFYIYFKFTQDLQAFQTESPGALLILKSRIMSSILSFSIPFTHEVTLCIVVLHRKTFQIFCINTIFLNILHKLHIKLYILDRNIL